MLSRILAPIRTVATYAVVAGFVLVAGPPGLALAIAFRWPMVLFRLGLHGNRLMLTLAGIRRLVTGTEHVRVDRAAVYCVNHASHLEPPIVYTLLHPLFPKLLVIYKKELRKVPVLGKVWEVGGFIPIDRKDKRQSYEAIALAAQRLREGFSFLVFPEGTRSQDGTLQPFKKGAFILAISAQAPIVPVAILGTQRAMRRGSWVIRPTRVKVKFGEPVETKGLTIDDRDRLIADVHARVSAMLQEG